MDLLMSFRQNFFFYMTKAINFRFKSYNFTCITYFPDNAATSSYTQNNDISSFSDQTLSQTECICVRSTVPH